MTVQEAKELIIKSEFYDLPSALDALDDMQAIKIVAEELNISKYRWFETSTTVVELTDGYLGIHGVTTIYSEAMSSGDCGVRTTCSEYEPYTTISYKPKEYENMYNE